MHGRPDWGGWLLVSFLLGGCQWAPRSDLTAAEGKLRVLGEQNQAQLAEIANLRAHSQALEDRVLQMQRESATAHRAGDGELPLSSR